ncbi:alpha/beta hydrolase [Sporosarcina sp. FSL K6-1522]|uniref:alpha/beta hydrolase n=1 Tax=Sporosarcina sp. FSL K6-1522 TaxID=2921554 RepID=UPI00315A0D9B
MWKWEAEGQPKAVVVIVHGAYEHHSRYAWLIQELRSSGFHVVAGDLPGHGARAAGQIHNEAFDDYVTYVEKLFEVGIHDNLPLFIIGHGLGATLAMHLLQIKKMECAGMILSSPWLALTHLPPKFSAMLTKLSSSMQLNHAISVELLTRNEELYEEMQQDELYNPIVTAGWYKELQTLMKAVYEGKIHNVPILLHSGEQDRISDPTYAKKWLMNQGLSEFQYKEWHRLYHDVYQEPEREEVSLYTQSFMNNVLRSLGYVV